MGDIFHRQERRFTLEFFDNGDSSVPTEIFVPQYQYPEGVVIQLSDGRAEHDERTQTLRYWHEGNNRDHKVVIARK